MDVLSKPLRIKRRIGFSETDAAGLIHFTTYFTLMEAAEAELFRSLGIDLLRESDGKTYGFPRIDCQCKFRRPLGFDDPVTVSLDIEAIVANRICYTFTFTGPDGTTCASGSMTTAYVCRGTDGQLQSSDLPDSVRESLEAWKNQQV